MAGLVEKLKADPGSVSWAGGSAGGTDHITAGLIAKAVGVDPTKVNYIAFSGGGEALAAILGNQVTVGISGYGEFAEQVKAGHAARHRHFQRRADRRHRRADLQGGRCRRVVQNWRMVAAGPASRPSRWRPSSPTSRRWPTPRTWKKTLATKGWINTWLAGDEFKQLEGHRGDRRHPQGHRSRSNEPHERGGTPLVSAAPTGRRLSSRRMSLLRRSASPLWHLATGRRRRLLAGRAEDRAVCHRHCLALLGIWTAIEAWRGDFPEREPQELAAHAMDRRRARQMLTMRTVGFSIATGVLFG
jgi:hypothetical protein